MTRAAAAGRAASKCARVHRRGRGTPRPGGRSFSRTRPGVSPSNASIKTHLMDPSRRRGSGQTQRYRPGRASLSSPAGFDRPGQPEELVVVWLISVALILAIGRATYQTPFAQDPGRLRPGSAGRHHGVSIRGVAVTAFLANADAPQLSSTSRFSPAARVGCLLPVPGHTPVALRHIGDAFPRWVVETLRASYLGFDYVHTPDGAGHGRLLQP